MLGVLSNINNSENRFILCSIAIKCVRMLHQCDICGKTLSRKEHLHRHINNVHGESHSVQSIPIVNGSLASNPPTTEDDMYTDDEMEGQISEESYTDEETGEETEEESSENYDESEEEDNNPWKLILNEVYQKMHPIRMVLVWFTKTRCHTFK